MMEHSMLRANSSSRQRSLREKGMTLIELMIAMTVLTVGLAGLLALITTAIANNSRAKMDTGGTLVAQLVIETISAKRPQAGLMTVTVQDCAGANWIIDTTDAAAPGAGAQLNANNGIDFVGQAYAAAPANYKMQYRSCGPNGTQVTYDVRWNIRTLNGFSKIVTVSARPTGATNADNTAVSTRFFQQPVTLRSIAVAGN